MINNRVLLVLATCLPLILTACSSDDSPPPGDAANTTIKAADTSIDADGASTTTITVQAVNAKGVDLTYSGGTVALATTAGTLSAVTDNKDGTYTATLISSATIETATISGTIRTTAITDTATVDFIAARLGSQVGSISVDTATDTVTVLAQPDDFELTPTAVYAAGTLTITMAVDSNFTPRLLFNPKLWVYNISDGSFDTSGTYAHNFNGVDYMYYGPEAMDSEATPVSRDIVITGVPADAVVTMFVEVTDAPMLLTRDDYAEGQVLTDSSTGVAWGQIDCLDISFRTLGENKTPQVSRGACGVREVIVSEDGTKIYSSNKTHPTVSVIDTTTLTYTLLSNVTATADDNIIGSVLDIAFNSDRSKLYALLNQGGHGTAEGTISDGIQPGTTDIELVELDPATLAVTNRVAIVSQTGENIRAKSVAISPDGTRAAIPVDHDDAESGIYFVDLTTMALIDANGAAAGVLLAPTVDLASESFLVKKAVFVDNDTVVISYSGYTSGTYSFDGTQDKLTFIDLTDFSTTDFTSSITNSAGNVQAGDLLLGPDGNIYWTRACFSSPMKDAAAYLGTEVLSVINPATMVETLVQLGDDLDNGNANACGYGVGMAFSTDGSTLYVANDWYGNTTESVTVLDVATLERKDMDGDDTDGFVGNSDALAKFATAGGNFAAGHNMAITPF